jgi:hypothetical protein
LDKILELVDTAETRFAESFKFEHKDGKLKWAIMSIQATSFGKCPG